MVENKIIEIDERRKSRRSYKLKTDDVEFIRNEINDAKKRIYLDSQYGNKYKLQSNGYVGTVTLPSEKIIEATPKAAGDNAIYLVQYATNISGDVEDARTNLGTKRGSNLLDPFASRFIEEMNELLDEQSKPNLHFERERKRTRKIDHRKLAKGGVKNTSGRIPRKKEKEKNYDLPINGILLTAGAVLIDATSRNEVENELGELVSDLSTYPYEITKYSRPSRAKNDISTARRQVERNPSVPDVYDDLLDIAKAALSLEGTDIYKGNVASHSYFINMEDVFEDAIQRAVERLAPNHLRVDTQKPRTSLIDGPQTVVLKPDLVIYDTQCGAKEPILIIDVKWKTEVNNSDIYQLTTYQAAYDTMPMIVLPKTEESLEGRYEFRNSFDLQQVSLPVSKEVESYEEFCEMFESAVSSLIPGHSSDK